MLRAHLVQIRLYAMGNVRSDNYWGSQIPRLLHYGKHGRLNVRSVKLYTDGMSPASHFNTGLVPDLFYNLRCIGLLGCFVTRSIH